MKDLFHTKPFRAVLWILGTLVILMIVFGSGVAVGYRSGLFASRYGQDYYRNFIGAGHGGMGMFPGGMMPPPIVNQYGVIGTVISVGSSTISMQDPAGNEQSIMLDAATVIREMDATVSASQIREGSHIAVIGEPNDTGQIHARFIRVFLASSSILRPPANP